MPVTGLIKPAAIWDAFSLPLSTMMTLQPRFINSQARRLPANPWPIIKKSIVIRWVSYRYILKAIWKEVIGKFDDCNVNPRLVLEISVSYP